MFIKDLDYRCESRELIKSMEYSELSSKEVMFTIAPDGLAEKTLQHIFVDFSLCGHWLKDGAPIQWQLLATLYSFSKEWRDVYGCAEFSVELTSEEEKLLLVKAAE